MNESLKIAGVQMDVSLLQKAGNLSTILQRLETAAKAGAGLVIFPECALTGYCFENREEVGRMAEPVPGPSTWVVAEACQKFNTHAVLGMVEQSGQYYFNAAVLVAPNNILAKYRKVHLPSLGLDKLVSPGNIGLPVHETPLGRIGLNICYDCSFPESARVMALNGADLVVLPTNWPGGAEETAEYVINARALENHIYYAAVNRVGEERGFRFIGRSRIADCHGRTLALGSPDQEEIIYAEIVPVSARDKHIVRVPGKHEIDRFKDRRPELYGEITKMEGEHANAKDERGRS